MSCNSGPKASLHTVSNCSADGAKHAKLFAVSDLHNTSEISAGTFSSLKMTSRAPDIRPSSSSTRLAKGRLKGSPRSNGEEKQVFPSPNRKSKTKGSVSSHTSKRNARLSSQTAGKEKKCMFCQALDRCDMWYVQHAHSMRPKMSCPHTSWLCRKRPATHDPTKRHAVTCRKHANRPAKAFLQLQASSPSKDKATIAFMQKPAPKGGSSTHQ